MADSQLSIQGEEGSGAGVGRKTSYLHGVRETS